MANLIDLRDEAINGSRMAHDRMRQELAIYRNEGYSHGNLRATVGGVYSMAKESVDPKIRTGVNRLIPGFIENMGRIEVQPDRSYRTEDDIQFCEDIQNWLDMNDEATDEGEELHIAVQHNLSIGNCVTKIGWDARRMVVTSDAINPLNFSVDPSCRKSNLSDAGFVNHREYQTGAYIRRHAPEFVPPRQATRDKFETQVMPWDELWVRPEIAAECGVEVDPEEDGVLRAIIIDDKIHKVRHSPYWWPEYPFAHWRNFFDVDAKTGKAHSFWGHGYGEQLWSNQKLLDELLANLILISRNQAVGRFISKEGMLDMEQVLPIHGLNIEFPDGFTLQDLMHLPPDALPPDLYHIIEKVTATIDAEIPSLSDTYTGEEPKGATSGRAINALQYASFSQLSANIRRMNDYRLRRARIKVTMLQQYAKRPLRPHLWRGGLDLPEVFPEDARHIGYHLSMPDTSSIPNTPAGRLQIVQLLAGMGMVMSPERLIEFVGLDKGFGIKAEDFMMAAAPGMAGAGGAPQTDEQVTSGLEAAMKVER